MYKKLGIIILYFLSTTFMIGLIPLVADDYLLAFIYALFIVGLLLVKREKSDLTALLFGFIAITLSELFFVSTGVETFTQESLFGLIPLWLPFLWAYAFVVIKRSLRVLDR